MRRGTLALAGGLAALLRVGSARAAPFDLDWSAPEDCPSRERMMAASREALGEGESNGPPELFVHGTVSDDHGALVVQLRVTDIAGADLGERRVRFQDRRCKAIEEPTALLVAMMIAVARSRDPAHELAPAAEGAPVKPVVETVGERPETVGERPETVGKRPAPPPRAPATRIPMTFGASGIASFGVLPNVGMGGAVRWTASFSRVVLGVEGSFETTWATPAASGEATFRLFDSGALAGVRLVGGRTLEVVPIVALRGGILTASTSGFVRTDDVTRLVGAVAAGALLRIRGGPATHFEVLPDIRVPFARDTFAVREGDKLIRIHTTATVEARLALGLGWSF